MHAALWASVTGLDAQNNDIRVISNNLANVGTTGFKKGRPVFEDLLYQKIKQPGGNTSESTNAPSGIMFGTGVKTVATQKAFTQGALRQTENALDVAIEGRGFFQVVRPDGSTSYTRDGKFQMDASGNLVTASGYALQPSITIPAQTTSITIGSDGTVSVTTAGSGTSSTVGTIQLSDFINPSGLEPIGENQFIETTASGTPTTANPQNSGLGALNQGYIEESNVNVVEELVRLIETQRAYEMNAKAIETVDGMLRYISQTL